MNGTADQLLRRCNAALEGGADFPTVWNSLLRQHDLVSGLPVQEMGAGKAKLVIQLVTGQRLVFDSAAMKLALT
jgi:hypothetical protein